MGPILTALIGMAIKEAIPAVIGSFDGGGGGGKPAAPSAKPSASSDGKITIKNQTVDVEALADKVMGVVNERLEKDPVFINETNSEKPFQSRVVLGTSVSVLVGAAVTVLNIVAPEGIGGLTWDQVATQTVTAIGAAISGVSALYALYGRLKSGLKPLFSWL